MLILSAPASRLRLGAAAGASVDCAALPRAPLYLALEPIQAVKGREDALQPRSTDTRRRGRT